MTYSHYIQPEDLIDRPKKFSRVVETVVRKLSLGCLNNRNRDSKDSLLKYKVSHYVFNAETKKMKKHITEHITNFKIEEFERFIEEEIIDDVSIASDWSDTSLDQYLT